MSVITIETKAWNMLMDKLNFLEATMKALAHKNSGSKYMTEEEVMIITGLTKDSLYRKRKAGVLRSATATGRKIKYLRVDVEKYERGDVVCNNTNKR